MNSNQENTFTDEKAVDAYLRKKVSIWLKWIGIANLGTLTGMILYVMFQLPDIAAERLVPGMNQRVANLTTNLENKLGEAFVLSGKVESQYDALFKRSSTLKADIDKIQADIRATQGSDLAGVTNLVRAMGNSKDIPGLVQRLGKIEQDIANLGKVRDGTTFTVTNPLMGSAKAVCPPGTFVSRVLATKGVGGKYAGDGISELTIVCSPVR